jgi:predicted nucleic acid-binding protein
MILSDTTIIVAYWRKPSAAQRHIFSSCPVAFCGITRAELYVGAKTEQEIANYAAELSLLNEIPLDNSIWGEVGRNLRTLRLRGITVPFTDAVIATVALENDLEVWTYDAHFKLIQTVILGLRIFQEPVVNP